MPDTQHKEHAKHTIDIAENIEKSAETIIMTHLAARMQSSHQDLENLLSNARTADGKPWNADLSRAAWPTIAERAKASVCLLSPKIMQPKITALISSVNEFRDGFQSFGNEREPDMLHNSDALILEAKAALISAATVALIEDASLDNRVGRHRALQAQLKAATSDSHISDIVGDTIISQLRKATGIKR